MIGSVCFSCSQFDKFPLFFLSLCSDLLKNPLIVPLKVIHAHKVSDSLGVLSLAYHPTQPWILSSAADGTIRLFQDIH
jgi:ribosome biogenesis protein ERB1